MPGEIIVNNTSITNTKSYPNTFASYYKGVYGIVSLTAIFLGNFIVGRRYKIAFIGTSDFTIVGSPSNLVGYEFQATFSGVGSSGSGYCYEITERISEQNFLSRHTTRNSTSYSDLTESDLPIFIGTERVKHIDPNSIIRPVRKLTIQPLFAGATVTRAFSDIEIRNIITNSSDTTVQKAVVVLQGGGGGGGGGKAVAFPTRDAGGGGSGGLVVVRLNLINSSLAQFGLGSGGAAGTGGSSTTNGGTGQLAYVTYSVGDPNLNTTIYANGGGGGGGHDADGVAGTAGTTFIDNLNTIGATLLQSFDGAAGGRYNLSGGSKARITTPFSGSLFGMLASSSFLLGGNVLFLQEAATTTYSAGTFYSDAGGSGAGSNFGNGGNGSDNAGSAATAGGLGAGGGGGNSSGSGNATSGARGGNGEIRIYF